MVWALYDMIEEECEALNQEEVLRDEGHGELNSVRHFITLVRPALPFNSQSLLDSLFCKLFGTSRSRFHDRTKHTIDRERD